MRKARFVRAVTFLFYAALPTVHISHYLTIGEFVAHGANVNCLALSPGNGRTLATGGEDRRVNVWMVGNPTPLLVS